MDIQVDEAILDCFVESSNSDNFNIEAVCTSEVISHESSLGCLSVNVHSTRTRDGNAIAEQQGQNTPIRPGKTAMEMGLSDFHPMRDIQGEADLSESLVELHFEGSHGVGHDRRDFLCTRPVGHDTDSTISATLLAALLAELAVKGVLGGKDAVAEEEGSEEEGRKVHLERKEAEKIERGVRGLKRDRIRIYDIIQRRGCKFDTIDC